jgi:hypothetical protein
LGPGRSGGREKYAFESIPACACECVCERVLCVCRVLGMWLWRVSCGPLAWALSCGADSTTSSFEPIMASAVGSASTSAGAGAGAAKPRYGKSDSVDVEAALAHKFERTCVCEGCVSCSAWPVSWRYTHTPHAHTLIRRCLLPQAPPQCPRYRPCLLHPCRQCVGWYVGVWLAASLFTYTERDVCLYALTVGASEDALHLEDLPLTYDRARTRMSALRLLSHLF